MGALIKMVSERAGIDEGQASKAIEVVIGQLKDKLPEPIAGQIEGLLSGEGGDAPDVGDALGGIGKKFGL